MQALLAGLLVAGCTAFAAWSLAPAAWRRRMVALLAPWPSAAARLAKSAPSAGCGGCKGCADGAPSSAGGLPGVAPIVFHRRI